MAIESRTSMREPFAAESAEEDQVTELDQMREIERLRAERDRLWVALTALVSECNGPGYTKETVSRGVDALLASRTPDPFSLQSLARRDS